MDSIPFLYIYFGFYSIAITPLPIAYTVEILPFGKANTANRQNDH